MSAHRCGRGTSSLPRSTCSLDANPRACYCLRTPSRATPYIHHAAAAVLPSGDLAAVCAEWERGVAASGLLPDARNAPLHDVRGRAGGDAQRKRGAFHSGANEMPAVSEGGKPGSASSSFIRSSRAPVCRSPVAPGAVSPDGSVGAGCTGRRAA